MTMNTAGCRGDRLLTLCLCISAMGGCGEMHGQSGSYFMPQAVIGIALRDESEADRARETVSLFAELARLRRERIQAYDWQPERLREELSKTQRTSFAPSELRSDKGIDMVLVETSPHCWMLQVHDRTGSWSRSTFSKVYEMHRYLATSGSRTEILVPPEGMVPSEANQRKTETFCARASTLP